VPYVGTSSPTGTIYYPPRGEAHRGHGPDRSCHRYDTGYGVVDGTPLHSMALDPLIGTRTSPRVDARGGPSFNDYWRRTGFAPDSVSVGGFRQGRTTNDTRQTDPYVGTSMPSGTTYYPPTQYGAQDVHRSQAPTCYWPHCHGDSAHYFVNGAPVMLMEEPFYA